MTRLPTVVTEAHVKALVKKWFDSYDAWSFAPVQSGLGVHGIPDRLGCVAVQVTEGMVGKWVSLFVAVESKRPGRRGEKDRGMSRHQVQVLNDIAAVSGIAVCCDGVEDLAALDELIAKLTA